MENKLKRIKKSIQLLRKAEKKRCIKYLERKWIEHNKKIHAFNYWFYRYFTNEFELFIVEVDRF